MSRDFIELYDDDGYRYIVNMDKISFVNVAGRKVWAGEAATLAICDESMERLLSMADFKSGHGLTFLGDENWLVCPRDLAHELYDERLLPFGVQVYCPDNGGALRLTYDLRMQAAKSLREDSTLCLLWAMLMDSYSRWRTTWDVFNETGESYDL